MSQTLSLDQLRPFQPLIVPEAVEYFENILTSDSVVFESGSGTSTPWLAQRAREVFTTEHDPDWAETVRNALMQDGLGNVKLSLFSHAEYENKYYDVYADHILQFPNESFDVVFVDGVDRTRVPAMTYARKKIKPGGWLVVDDSNWPKLSLGLRRFDSWPHITLCGWKEGAIDGEARFGCTTFFHKPIQPRIRIGIVSNWTRTGQVDVTLRAYDKLKDSFDLFFLLRGDPLDTSLGQQRMMPRVTWADFERGVKLFCCPISWAQEKGLDWILYTEFRKEHWLEDLRGVGFRTGFLADFLEEMSPR